MFSEYSTLPYLLMDISLILLSDQVTFYITIFFCALFGAGSIYGFLKVYGKILTAEQTPVDVGRIRDIPVKASQLKRVSLGKPLLVTIGGHNILFMLSGMEKPAQSRDRALLIQKWIENQLTGRHSKPAQISGHSSKNDFPTIIRN